MNFNGNRYNLTDDAGVVQDSPFALMPGLVPRAIDIHRFEGKGPTIQGIYVLDGDTLRTCWTSPGFARPTEFSTKQGTGFLLQTWQRSR